MNRNKQVCKFMYDDVFQALPRLLCQIGIDSDMPTFRIAASPFRLHVLDEDSFHRHSYPSLPDAKQLGQCLTDLVAIPRVEYLRPILRIGPWTHIEHQPSTCKRDPGRTIDFHELEHIAPAPYIMAFPIDILARRFTTLPEQTLLLLPYPPQFCHGE